MALLLKRLVLLALRHPLLIPDLLRTGWAVRRFGWYAKPPFLPLPAWTYLRWRMDTAYGDPDVIPPADEFRRYLRWARDLRRAARNDR